MSRRTVAVEPVSGGLAPVDVLIVGGGATGAGVLRDLARRGVRCLLVEKGDLGSGTTGRYHGLLHSGGRYVVKDPRAARECVEENQILRRIAAACIEDTGGYFVSTRDDPDDYAEGFPAACAASGVPCEEVSVVEVLRQEPALDPTIKRAFRVPDASLEPWQLIAANVADARAHGSDALAYHRLCGFERQGERIVSAQLRDERSGAMREVATGFVVSAAGAWAGQVAGMAAVPLAMVPGKGTMLVYNQRMTDAVINRCHAPADGDIMVPVHTVDILGTTDIRVDDPDRYEVTRAEVAELVAEGSKLFPGLPAMRILRAYAGVRPLYDETIGDPAGAEERSIPRSHVVIDHEARDGVPNLVSIVGGKATTYRLMAEETADLVCAKLGVTQATSTADESLPGQEAGHGYWLGHRLADHERDGGGDADLMCECELVTRAMLDDFLETHWPCTLDDVRRGTRLGMGPCQGGFCTFRAAGVVAQRTDPGDPGDPAGMSDRAVEGFLRERFKGIRPIAWGRQLQELWMVSGIYTGVLGVGSLPAVQPGTRDGDRAAS
jgi:glycerol-3-phosphate dehydrogenase